MLAILPRLIDQRLDGLWIGDVGVVGLPVGPGRLDEKVTGPEHPLPYRLLERHIVDHLEGELLALLGDQTHAMDEPLGGYDMQRREPADEPSRREHEPRDDERADHPQTPAETL